MTATVEPPFPVALVARSAFLPIALLSPIMCVPGTPCLALAAFPTSPAVLPCALCRPRVTISWAPAFATPHLLNNITLVAPLALLPRAFCRPSMTVSRAPLLALLWCGCGCRRRCCCDLTSRCRRCCCGLRKCCGGLKKFCRCLNNQRCGRCQSSLGRGHTCSHAEWVSHAHTTSLHARSFGGCNRFSKCSFTEAVHPTPFSWMQLSKV